MRAPSSDDLESVVASIHAAPQHLSDVIEQIWPFPHAESDITERNLGAYLLHELRSRGWVVYVEMPLAGVIPPTLLDQPSGSNRQHIDLFALRGSTAVVMEAKCVSSADALCDLATDYRRLRDLVPASLIRPYFHQRGKPAPLSIIYLVMWSTWSAEFAVPWEESRLDILTGARRIRGQLVLDRFGDLTRRSIVARSTNHPQYPTWWWCYGLIQESLC